MMKSVIARVLKASEIPAKARVAPNKAIRLSEWEGRQHVLVHDGKHIIVRHGPESVTGTGNPALVMVCGSEKEIDAEIKRLGLAPADSAVSPSPRGTYDPPRYLLNILSEKERDSATLVKLDEEPKAPFSLKSIVEVVK